MGDTLRGCWATIGVLTEKGNPKTSSIGQSYSICKIGCLDENTVSLFLFGDAYQQNCKEQAGTVFALFSCAVRKDNKVSTCRMQYAHMLIIGLFWVLCMKKLIPSASFCRDQGFL